MQPGQSLFPSAAAGRSPGDDQLFRQASEAWEAGDYESLLPRIERALRGSRDHRLWHIHGLMLRQLDRRAEALPSLQRAAELAPNNANMWRSLALTLYEAGVPSLQAYGRALQLQPGDPGIVSEMTFAFVNEGRVQDAIDGLARILARSPLWVDGHVMLSKLRWMQGERDGFTRSFDEALAQYPQAADLRREQIIALLHACHWDRLFAAIEAGRAALGDLPLFSVNEAIAHAELGHTETADALFAPFAGTQDMAVQVRRVRHFLRSGRLDQAGELIEAWLDRPEAYMIWPYAAILWRMTGDPRWEWLEGQESFIGVYDIADRLPPLDRLAETLRGLHTLSGQPLDQSLRGGTQTDGDIFMRIDPVLVQLREAVRATVEEHVARFPPRDERHPLLAPARSPIAFAGSWSVRLHSQGFHANHIHPVGWISSALYVALPADVGQNEAGYLTLGDPSAPQFEIDLPPFRTIEPKPGRLVLFPSYTFHGTKPFGEGERLTVAFDVARRN